MSAITSQTSYQPKAVYFDYILISMQLESSGRTGSSQLRGPRPTGKNYIGHACSNLSPVVRLL